MNLWLWTCGTPASTEQLHTEQFHTEQFQTANKLSGETNLWEKLLEVSRSPLAVLGGPLTWETSLQNLTG